MRPSNNGNLIAASFAEIVRSPAYGDAMATAAAQRASLMDARTPEAIDISMAEQAAFEGIAIQGLRTYWTNRTHTRRRAENDPKPSDEQAWYVHRAAAIAQLRGRNLGAFSNVARRLGGAAKPAETDVAAALGRGAPDAMFTTEKITILMQENRGAPLNFLGSALRVIAQRRQERISNIGLANYATTLKYFVDLSDEALEFDLHDEAIRGTVSRMAGECLEGFIQISRSERPNFIEMTNLYAAIRMLPRGTVDARFTRDLLALTLDQLPTFDYDQLWLTLAALGNMDLTAYGDAAADTITLVLRKMNGLDRTRDMRQALGAIANLPSTPVANRAFAAFLAERNQLERSLTIGEAVPVMQRLQAIVDDVINDPALTRHAYWLAEYVTKHTFALLRKLSTDGQDDLSSVRTLKERATTVGKIYEAMLESRKP